MELEKVDIIVSLMKAVKASSIQSMITLRCLSQGIGKRCYWYVYTDAVLNPHKQQYAHKMNPLNG